MAINYMPKRTGVDIEPFRFWCQKILPLVYDDSISYYELLCKVVDYLNMTMQDVNTLNGDVTNMYTAFEQLQNYVNTYFDSLDVQEEINNKLDDMAESGELTELLAGTVADTVGDWLDEHITPTSPALDDTLTVPNAAAEAKATGDRINAADFSDRIAKGEGTGGVVTGALILNDINENSATGQYATAEGSGSSAYGNASHAEGSSTSSGVYAHAEGQQTSAGGAGSHAEGYNTGVLGDYAHVEGENTLAYKKSQHVVGRYNVADTGTGVYGSYAEIVGNGASGARSNARTLDWEGNEVVAGKITVGEQGNGDMDVATKGYIDNEISTALYVKKHFTFEQGTINSTNGTKSTSNYRIRTVDFTGLNDIENLYFDNTLLANICWYTTNIHASANYVGQTGWLSSPVNIANNVMEGGTYYKIVLRYASGMSVTITPSDITDNMIYGVAGVLDNIEEELDDIYDILDELSTKPAPFTVEIRDEIDIIKSWDVTSSNSGCCFAENGNSCELWTFAVGADDNQTDAAWYRRTFNKETMEFGTSVGGRHTLGHVNACSYNQSKDAFICGNGSGSYTLAGKIYLVENAFAKQNLYIEDALVINFADYGTKVNAIWGDSNDGKNNIIFVITNDGYDVYRVILGEGETTLEGGTLQKTTGFNGTYKILKHWEYGTVKEDYPNVVQGAYYYDGKVCWGFGHYTGVIPLHWVELLNTDVKTGGVDYHSYADDGTMNTRSICGATNLNDLTFCVYSNKIYCVKI